MSWWQQTSTGGGIKPLEAFFFFWRIVSILPNFCLLWRELSSLRPNNAQMWSQLKRGHSKVKVTLVCAIFPLWNLFRNLVQAHNGNPETFFFFFLPKTKVLSVQVLGTPALSFPSQQIRVTSVSQMEKMIVRDASRCFTFTPYHPRNPPPPTTPRSRWSAPNQRH